MNVVLLGAPGSGKGTQARRIAEWMRVPQLSTGDMLREAVDAGTDVGRQAQAVMDSGGLVPDRVVSGVVADRLDRPDTAAGAVFDGYPRTLAQAEDLDRLLGQRGRAVGCALEIRLGEQVLEERIVGRFSCSACGEGYHSRYKPPATENVCDGCGASAFLRRADDNPDTVRRRLAAYHGETAPLIARYREAALLRVVDGGGSIDEVAAQVDAALGRGDAADAAQR